MRGYRIRSLVGASRLRRIPDYQIDTEATRFYQGNPELTGVVTMPTTFTPATVTGRSEAPF